MPKEGTIEILDEIRCELIDHLHKMSVTVGVGNTALAALSLEMTKAADSLLFTPTQETKQIMRCQRDLLRDRAKGCQDAFELIELSKAIRSFL